MDDNRSSSSPSSRCSRRSLAERTWAIHEGLRAGRRLAPRPRRRRGRGLA